MYPISILCKHNHTEAASLLISKGYDVNQHAGIISPLMYACANGNLKIVTMLLRAGAIVNPLSLKYIQTRPNTVLKIACLKGYIDIVEILLKNGAKIYNDDPNNSFVIACNKGYLNIGLLLVINGAHPVKPTGPVRRSIMMRVKIL